MLSAGAAAPGVGMLGAGAGSTAGAGAGAGGMTAAQSASFNALGGELANPAIWQTATANAGEAAAGTGTGGMLQAPATQFVTQPIPVTGILGEAPVAEGMMPGAYSDVAGEQFAMAHPPPGLLAQGMGYAGKLGKAASAYSTVNKAVGAGQPQHQAPQGRPIFQGEAPPIAAPAAVPVAQSPVLQSGGTAGDMLRGVAQQRLRKRF
jgi:hypothetical protein